MTIYVDELPKDDCPCNRDGRCRLLQEGCYVCYFEMEKNEHCPLQSLADYTKQVRKEEKIKINRLVRNWLIKKGFTTYEFDELFEEIRGTENE